MFRSIQIVHWAREFDEELSVQCLPNQRKWRRGKIQEESLEASKIQFQTLDNNSADHLSSTSVCSRSSTKIAGSKNGAPLRLELVHRYGPCAADDAAPLTLAEILAKDQLRVQSIQDQSLHNNYTNNNGAYGDYGPTQLAAQSGDSLGIAQHVVTIRLGTPTKKLTLIFDTGSDVTWTQCKPCHPNDCYKQHDPMFNPTDSYTYSKIPCESQYCTELGQIKRGTKGCLHQNAHCPYKLYYGDRSHTTGFYSRDTLTLSPRDVFHNFRFGCGSQNSNGFGQTAGILGLGKGPTSFVSQTERKYSGVFAYCLPDINSTGFLSFGGGYDYYKGMVFTHLIVSFSLSKYHISIIAIRMSGSPLQIKESIFTDAGAIIDSGTVLTYLPPEAYRVMSTEFKRLMIRKYTSAPAYDNLLDTCFHITKKDKVPSISFTFKDDATMDLAQSGILYYINSSFECLAFASNRNPRDSAVFGSTQQLKYEMMYDVHNNRLGFKKNPRCY